MICWRFESSAFTFKSIEPGPPIEPMITMGSVQPVIWSDGWTAAIDGMPAKLVVDLGLSDQAGRRAAPLPGRQQCGDHQGRGRADPRRGRRAARAAFDERRWIAPDAHLLRGREGDPDLAAARGPHLLHLRLAAAPPLGLYFIGNWPEAWALFPIALLLIWQPLVRSQTVTDACRRSA